jgi:molybdopterin-synthase adenylyltransferase
MDFTELQIERYSRHILLQEVGSEGQKKLLNAKVLVVGAGGLGSAVLLYLAAAGIGTIGIIDGDVVDITNLQRQIIHSTKTIGISKVMSAKQRIEALNPDVKILCFEKRLTTENAIDIIKDFDFVVEATDNFNSKFLVNDACVMAGKPFSQGGVLRFEGQTFTYVPGSACYRCLYQAPPPDDKSASCSQAGILGSIAGMLGTIQATEVLKYFTQAGQLLTNKLLSFDALSLSFKTINVCKDEECIVCGRAKDSYNLKDEIDSWQINKTVSCNGNRKYSQTIVKE